MNRRRFLSMLGMLPAALALPHDVDPPSTVEITTKLTSLAQDLKYGQLVRIHGGESIIPGKPPTPVERVVDAAVRFQRAYKELEAAEADLDLPPTIPPHWWIDNLGG